MVRMLMVSKNHAAPYPLNENYADANFKLNLNSKQANVYSWIIYKNYCYYVDKTL